MIDFIRLTYLDKDKIERFLINEENFKSVLGVVDIHSGELSYPLTTRIGCMEVRINDKTVYVKNSLHKLFNELQGNKGHNHNDFGYPSLCYTIDHISSELIDLDKTRLTQLEFGLNIEIPEPAEGLIKDCIVLHKLKFHNVSNQFDGKGEFKQFNYYNYYFKIYDKGKQYKLDKHIIRFEVKYRRARGFNPLGIVNLHDLKKKELLQALFDDLLKRFDELIIVDRISANSKMTKRDKLKLESYLSYNYWEKLSSRENRNRKSREVKAFKNLLQRNDLLTTKTLLKNGLIQKFKELIN